MSFAPSLTARLVRYGQRGAQEARLHERRTVQWTVAVDPQGRVLHVLPHPRVPKGETPHQVLAPREAKARSLGIAPLLLTDNAGYVLGLNREGARTLNGEEKRAAYLDLLARAAPLHPDLQAALIAARALTPADLPDAQSGDLITFTVDGRNPHEHPVVQDFWIELQTGSPGGDAGEAEDAVTGQRGPLVRNSPLLKGVPGGKAMLTYQSKNASAFTAYGLTDLGVTGATLEAAARAVTQLALDPATSYTRPGWDFRVLHWLDSPAPDPWFALLDPTNEDIQRQLQAQERGTGEEGVMVNLALVRGNGARLVVLDHAQLPLHQAARHARAYLTRSGSLPLWRAENALTNTAGRVVTHLLPALHRHALLGTPLPGTVRQLILTHWRQQLRLTRDQRALLTLTLPEVTLQDPDTLPDHLRVPYALGRYAATAHHVHRRAHPQVARTVTDRYLRLLSSQPARAFGQMERTLLAVLRSYRRQRPAAEHHLSAQLAASAQSITLPLPATLTAEQQSALALGYEHERARQFQEAQARRQATSPTPGE